MAYKLITKTAEQQLKFDPYKNNQSSWKLSSLRSNYYAGRVRVYKFKILIWLCNLVMITSSKLFGELSFYGIKVYTKGKQLYLVYLDENKIGKSRVINPFLYAKSSNISLQKLHVICLSFLAAEVLILLGI